MRLHNQVDGHRFDGWAEDSGKYMIRTYGHEIADLISGTINSWDPEATAGNNSVPQAIANDGYLDRSSMMVPLIQFTPGSASEL